MKRCDLCVRRPRHVGGNGTCPIFVRRVVGSSDGQDVREPLPDAYAYHLRLHPDGCLSFVAGDLRPRRAAVAQEGLF